MRLDLIADVPGVSPAAALAWWSDFRDGRTDHPFVPGTRRRLVERRADHATMEDETRWLGVRVFRERTTATLGSDVVRIVGRNGLASFEGSYRFEPVPGGARIHLVADVTLRPGLAWTDALAKPLVVAILRMDLRGHARELRRDLAPGGDP